MNRLPPGCRPIRPLPPEPPIDPATLPPELKSVAAYLHQTLDEKIRFHRDLVMNRHAKLQQRIILFLLVFCAMVLSGFVMDHATRYPDKQVIEDQVRASVTTRMNESIERRIGITVRQEMDKQKTNPEVKAESSLDPYSPVTPEPKKEFPPRDNKLIPGRIRADQF